MSDFVKCGLGLAIHSIYSVRDSALWNVRKQNMVITPQHMQIQAADGLCESSALVQHVSVTECHPEFLELMITTDMHWSRFPVRKMLSTFTVYFSDKTFLVTSRKLSY